MPARKVTRRDTQRAVGYIRVSTLDQVQEGHSLPAQRAKIEAYCQAHGLDLVRVFVDEGKSGTSKDRPAYNEMREYVLNDGIGHVVCSSLDRLGRSLKELITFYDLLEEKGVGISAIREGVDTSTAVGRLIRNVLGSVAEFEAELVAERTRVGLDAAKMKGIKLGRPSNVPDDVRGLVMGLREAGYGWTAIAKHLNDKRIPTAQGGSRWYPSTIRSLVASEGGE